MCRCETDEGRRHLGLLAGAARCADAAPSSHQRHDAARAGSPRGSDHDLAAPGARRCRPLRGVTSWIRRWPTTQPLNLTGQFYPLGRTPGPGSAFYLASEEIFGKPGAQVTLCFRRVVTSEQNTDQILDDQAKANAQAALKGLVDAARGTANAAGQAGGAVVVMTAHQGNYVVTLDSAVIALLVAAANAAATINDTLVAPD